MHDWSRRDFLAVSAGGALAACVPGCASRVGTTDPGRPIAATLPPIRGDADVDRLLPRLSNWGRWGEDDRRGTLNFITPRARVAAAREVHSGRSISLARESAFDDIERGEHEVTLRPMGSRDFIGMVFHGFEMTHLDGLAHVFADEERMYNGLPRSAVTESGAAELGVEAMGESGIMGRGVLLDVGALYGGALEPGTAIRPGDLEAAEAAQGVGVGSGDLLFVRTGAGRRNTREKRAGLHPECLSWLHAREVALLGGDGDSDAAPLEGFERWASAIHAAAIPWMGMPLVDNADLDPIAEACADERRWSFLAVVAPLRVLGMTGSPVAPIALF